MALIDLDHVNIRTTQLAAMTEWYGKVLGMHPGPRPDFAFPGAWLYLGERAVVHLVSAAQAQHGSHLTLEHFAFRAKDLAGFRATLEAQGVPYSIDPVPGIPVVQVNIRDPDRNHIHVDFDAAELDTET